MKKNFQLSLDEEKVAELRAWLAPKGMTFSGFMNSLICEQMDTVKKFNVPADASGMKLTEFARMFQKMAVSLAREAKRKK